MFHAEQVRTSRYGIAAKELDAQPNARVEEKRIRSSPSAVGVPAAISFVGWTRYGYWTADGRLISTRVL